ncbi:RHS repeat-associated core domain-containing protein [Xanthomonas arboricola]
MRLMLLGLISLDFRRFSVAILFLAPFWAWAATNEYGAPYTVQSHRGVGSFATAGDGVAFLTQKINALCNNTCTPRPVITSEYGSGAAAAIVYVNGVKDSTVSATLSRTGSPQKNLGGCSTRCTAGLGAERDGTGPRSSQDSYALANRANPGSQFEGDPINTTSGNLFRQDTDYESPSGLSFRRFYNSSQVVVSSKLGKQWRHIFDRSLEVIRTSPGLSSGEQFINVYRPDGGTTRFVLNNGVWVGDADVAEMLVERPSGDGYALQLSANLQTEVYDAAGVLQEIYAQNGQKLYSLQYSSTATPPSVAPVTGLLVSVVDAQGRSLQFSYDSTSRLTGVVLPDGAELSYGYDAAGYLASVTYPDGKSLGYRYNEKAFTAGFNLPGALTGIIDEKGVRYENITFNSSWRAISTSFAGNVDTTKVEYGSLITNGANSATVTGPLGTRTELKFANTGYGAIRPVGGSAACGDQCNQPWKSITYDASGYQASATDFKGNKTQTTFTPDGLLTQQIDAVGTPQQRTINTVWNTSLRLPTERTTLDAAGAAKSKTQWSYTSLGLQTAACWFDTAVAAVTSYICGSSANAPAGVRQIRTTYCEKTDALACPLIGLVLSLDGPRIDVADVTSYRYYLATDESGCGTTGGECHRAGDLFQVTNAAGQITTYVAYDKNGRLSRLREPNGVVIDYAYAPRGWITSSAIRASVGGATSTQDRITRVDYYPTGDVEKVTTTDGGFVVYSYDDAHRFTGITDQTGNKLVYSLDASGNRFKEEFKDASGSVKRTASRIYNKLGQLQTQADASANPTEFAYDLNGDLKLVTDALGRKTQLDPDPLRRVAHTLQDVGGLAVETTQQMDALDRVTAFIDPKGLTTRYDYNSLGDLSKLTSPDTGATTYSYDAAGNRTLEATARGVKISSSYDALGRLTKLSYPTSAFNITYTYDSAPASCQPGETFAIGRLASIKDSSGTTDYCYNGFGELVRKLQTTNGKALALRYAYTAAGRLTSAVYPDGAKVDYVRNRLGQVTEVGYTPAAGTRQILLKNISYLPLGPIAGWTYGNGRVLTRAYDQDYRPKAIQDTSAGGLDVGFGFDPVGNLSKLTPAGGTVADVTLGYDSLGRLTEFKDGVTGTVLDGYTYDKTGNRQSSKSAAGEVAYTYEVNSHRLTKVGAAPRVYNAVGDTTSINGTEREFVYEVTGRMSQVKRNGVVVGEYRYNGKGEQVRRFLGTANTYTLYDESGHWMGDYDSAGNPLQQAIWLDDMPVGVTGTDAKLAYIEPDHLGSPRVVVDPARNVAKWAWNLKGEAFGNTAPNQDPDQDGAGFVLDMRFPGQRYAAMSGLNQNYFRDFDVAAGRYIQSDPIGLNGGFSTYSYVEGDPLFSKDPLGLEKWVWISPIRDPVIYSGARADKDRPGILTIYAHGGPNAVNGPSFFNKYGLAFSADQVADIIEDSSWNRKDVVWLKSCNTGKDPNGFAQQLANRLGVTVYAPNAQVWFNKQGVIGPMPRVGGVGKADYSNPGQYTPFRPMPQVGK